ncbi:HIT family protein [Candidatus Pacearchaeota archaeon]|nr:HIT family protein [Candidatus Pacearchaeota archaeon]
MSDDCIFCNRELIKDDILYETENFFVKVGLMIAAPGHIMVISKNHIDNLSKMPECLFSEYLNLCKKVRNVVEKEFGNIFLVDYGPSAQSINHQHTHFIPLKSSEYDIKNFLNEAIDPRIGKYQKAHLKDLNKLVNGKDYTWFGIGSDTYVYLVDGVWNPEKDFGWRDFLLYEKGVKSIAKNWTDASIELKETDEVKRRITKEKLKRYFEN